MSNEPSRKDTAQALTLDQQVTRWLRVGRQAAPIAWLVVAVVGAVLLWPTVKPMLDRAAISKASFAGFVVEFADAKLANVRGLNKQAIAEKDREGLLRRFRELTSKTDGAMILWVDDEHPIKNASVRPALEAMGMVVHTATSTSEAKLWMAEADYDILITDLDRPKDEPAPCYSASEPASAGCDLLKKVGNNPRNAPAMIVYTLDFQQELGTPPFAMGVATTPTQLFHLILDAMSR
jgi:CheY-like chemotaxis protein